MKNRYIYTISIFAILILAVIAGFFLLDIPRTSLYYWAFFSLIFSLLVSLGSILLIYNNKQHRAGILYGASLSATTFLYLIAIIISLFFIKSYEEKVNSFVFLQLALNGLFLIIGIILSALSSSIHKKAEITSEKLKSGEYDKPSRGDF